MSLTPDEVPSYFLRRLLRGVEQIIRSGASPAAPALGARCSVQQCLLTVIAPQEAQSHTVCLWAKTCGGCEAAWHRPPCSHQLLAGAIHLASGHPRCWNDHEEELYFDLATLGRGDAAASTRWWFAGVSSPGRPLEQRLDREGTAQQLEDMLTLIEGRLAAVKLAVRDYRQGDEMRGFPTDSGVERLLQAVSKMESATATVVGERVVKQGAVKKGPAGPLDPCARNKRDAEQIEQHHRKAPLTLGATTYKTT